MTYEQALEWLEKNVPLGNYDNFSDWYEACQDKLSTPNLFGSAEFNRMLEQAWLNEFGSFDREEIDTTPSQADSEQRRIDITEEQRARISRDIPRREEPIERTPVIIPTREPIREPITVLPKDVPPQEKKTILQRIRQVFSRFRRKK